MRFVARDIMSEENSWSRNTVSPSLRDSWNQSLHVTLFPVQLWKYSCPMTPSILPNAASVALSGVASTSRELNKFRDLFSIAPMLKSSTATMLNRSRSYSSPNVSSSHFIARFSDSIAKSHRAMFFASAYIRSVTSFPLIVLKTSSTTARSPATSAKRYAG